EHGSLGFEIVGQRTVGDGDVGHQTGRGWRDRECTRNADDGFGIWILANPQSRIAKSRRYFFAAFSSSPSAITRTFRLVVTSRCSLIGTVNSPSFLIGSCSAILRLSISKPFASSACAMSAVVTEP